MAGQQETLPGSPPGRVAADYLCSLTRLSGRPHVLSATSLKVPRSQSGDASEDVVMCLFVATGIVDARPVKHCRLALVDHPRQILIPLLLSIARELQDSPPQDHHIPTRRRAPMQQRPQSQPPSSPSIDLPLWHRFLRTQDLLWLNREAGEALIVLAEALADPEPKIVGPEEMLGMAVLDLHHCFIDLEFLDHGEAPHWGPLGVAAFEARPVLRKMVERLQQVVRADLDSDEPMNPVRGLVRSVGRAPGGGGPGQGRRPGGGGPA